MGSKKTERGVWDTQERGALLAEARRRDRARTRRGERIYQRWYAGRRVPRETPCLPDWTCVSLRIGVKAESGGAIDGERPRSRWVERAGVRLWDSLLSPLAFPVPHSGFPVFSFLGALMAILLVREDGQLGGKLRGAWRGRQSRVMACACFLCNGCQIMATPRFECRPMRECMPR